MNSTPKAAIACPNCGSFSTVPIIYGLPVADDLERAQRGEFVLGGCLVGLHDPDPDPNRCCTTCGTSFDSASGHIVVS